ncbi:ketopantoate hydroxymethyltransferase-domain-containing protein [Plectosphaerella cucumerina]|uniref:3-methyl-2-oxobutanoate hydroxymethyltransferase n=1 Tax=Plectosphaerella cucumerina TaxID=40658 RepID=A0A8K0TTI8_9PEZI|nr:ketopantoate hydroxymethyltransferase-domain-containing protein [Plectosphaerella cucumerina]
MSFTPMSLPLRSTLLARSCASAITRGTRPLASTNIWRHNIVVAAGVAHQARWSSHSPLGTPLGASRKKVTIGTLRSLHKKNEPITMITAHDFPSAHVGDAAGMDMILVGDSLAMVALGMEDTSEVLLEEMLLHCKSVARATKAAFTVGDLPMGTYEISPEQALATAIRFVKEGRMQSVKLEGGKEMAPTIRKITTAGIPVLGHVGLTPQRQNALGGFRVQGKTAAGAARLLEDALAVQEAGAYAMVLEAVPAEVARLVTEKLSIPTIGIGAGNGCSGQVLVQIDMLGNFPPGRFLPKFVKKYGDVWGESMRAIEAYRDEVKSRQYPAPEHTYPIAKEELEAFENWRMVKEADRNPSAKGGVQSIGNDELIIRFEALSNVADNLLEGGSKRLAEVEEDAVRVAKLELLAQPDDKEVEFLGCADLEGRTGQSGSVADGPEVDNDLVLREAAGTGEGGGHVAWLGSEDGRGRHGQG